MTRPLYRDAVRHPAERPPEGHAGLWYDKFCNRWHVEGDSWSLASARDGTGGGQKLGWINTLTNGKVGVGDELDGYASRLARLVERRKGRYGVFVAESRFVTGLGRSHPVENGFAWHPTLGTPYLPGTSIKGMVRTWASLGAAPPAPRRDPSAPVWWSRERGPGLFPGCRSRRARAARARRNDAPLRRLEGGGASR